MGELATVLAHQGGWDEILVLAAPVAMLVVLLVLARRRAARSEAEDRRDAPGPA